MIRSQQAATPIPRIAISRLTQQRALMPLPAADARRLALIVGYQAMALINQDMTRVFTPCEEEAERRLTQFRMTQPK